MANQLLADLGFLLNEYRITSVYDDERGSLEVKGNTYPIFYGIVLVILPAQAFLISTFYLGFNTPVSLTLIFGFVSLMIYGLAFIGNHVSKSPYEKFLFDNGMKILGTKGSVQLDKGRIQEIQLKTRDRQLGLGLRTTVIRDVNIITTSGEKWHFATITGSRSNRDTIAHDVEQIRHILQAYLA